MERADIQLGTLFDGGDGIVFAPHKGRGGAIRDVAVSHFVATSKMQNAVVIEGTDPSQLLRNCHVRGNFVVASGAIRPQEQSTALLIRGPAPPRVEFSSVIYQVGILVCCSVGDGTLHAQCWAVQDAIPRPRSGEHTPYGLHWLLSLLPGKSFFREGSCL